MPFRAAGSSSNRRTGPGPLSSGSSGRTAADQGAHAAESALRLVLLLMFVNLGLSVLTTVITVLLRTSVVDFQMAHTHLTAGTPLSAATLRTTLESTLWFKLGASVVVSAFYIWRAYALRNGSRGAYLRLYYICIAGLVGLAYLILGGQYPTWMRVEQGVQAVVLVSLLVAVSRAPMRHQFAKRQQPV
jgi:hypothetical protein